MSCNAEINSRKHNCCNVKISGHTVFVLFWQLGTLQQVQKLPTGFLTLPALQITLVNFFVGFAWRFGIEKWRGIRRGFLVNFEWSPFPRKTKHEKSSEIRDNSEHVSVQNSGRKFEQFREFSFCNFSDLRAQRTKIAQSQSLAISALTEPNRQKSRRKKGSWAQKSQPEIANRQRLSIAPSNRNAALLSLVSEVAAISGVCDGHRNRENMH